MSLEQISDIIFVTAYATTIAVIIWMILEIVRDWRSKHERKNDK